MILCLDVGNTNIFGGVFKNNQIILRFRYRTEQNITSDQLGLFLSGVLQENGLTKNETSKIVICSVVPSIDYSLRAACKKYFKKEAFFLDSSFKTTLKLDVKTPREVGADRLATAIAATNIYPNKNLIVVDLGTATTLCAITKDQRYLSGAIMPGLKTAMKALQNNTAQLPAVEIVKPKHAIGCNTIDNIQSGLFYGQLGAIRELIKLFSDEQFKDEAPFVIGTGGFAYLFQDNGIFDVILPDLVLQGLYLAIKSQ